MRRKITIMTLVSCLIAGLVLTASLISFAGPQQFKPLPPPKEVPTKPIPPRPPRPCEGPDPAVITLKVTKNVITRDGKKIGVLNITAVMQNIGTKDFVSRPGQQSFVIVIKNPAVSGPRAYETLRSYGFYRLKKGAIVTLRTRYEIPDFIEWGHKNAHPSAGRCKAERIVLAYISYDPDILLDSNPQNDDCNGTGPFQTNNGKRWTIKYLYYCLV